MSAEIPGYDDSHNLVVEAVAFAASDVLRATGVEVGRAWTTGVRAADYASQILLTAMQNVHGSDAVLAMVDEEVIEEIAKIKSHFAERNTDQELGTRGLALGPDYSESFDVSVFAWRKNNG
jgi:hypothetical protein